MFYVELKEQEQEEVEDEDEIDKSIKEIHQSAQKLSDSIHNLASNQKLSEAESKPQQFAASISANIKGRYQPIYYDDGKEIEWNCFCGSAHPHARLYVFYELFICYINNLLCSNLSNFTFFWTSFQNLMFKICARVLWSLTLLTMTRRRKHRSSKVPGETINNFCIWRWKQFLFFTQDSYKRHTEHSFITSFFLSENKLFHACLFKIVKLREREGQRVDLGRSLKGHL